MKKAAVIMISFALVLSSFILMLDMTVDGKDIVPAPLFAGLGSGTVGDPYQITNVDELQEMNLELGANYTLMNDIDASATAAWNSEAGFVPIGNFTACFNGSLDGNGFKIINLVINRSTTDNVGLFGFLNGTVNNTVLINNNITGYDRVGSIVGYNNGTIINCHSTGSVTGRYSVGGFAGWMEIGTITNCTSTGDAVGTNDEIGGFIGHSYGTITNCSSTGNASGNIAVGGFTGKSYGTIKNSYSTGDASGGDKVGGFVGNVAGGSIMNCYCTGDVGGANYVGGFVGDNHATITNCSSTGNASGNNDVGGFVGFNQAGGTITNCFSTGNASGIGAIGDYVGGFVGFNQVGTITNCYSTGNASGIGGWVGGFAGRNDDTITDCFWDIETSGTVISAGGTGKTTVEMQNRNTFVSAGWDFSYIWDIQHTYTYPFFRWKNQPPIANDDNYAASEDSILSIPTSGVLGNDDDWELEPLTVTLFDNPSILGAVVNINSDGSFTYDPTGVVAFQSLAVGEYLSDSFSYTVSDGNGGEDTAMVTINVTGVNDAPIANGHVNVVNEDSLLNMAAPGVLANVSDLDASDILSVVADVLITGNGASMAVNTNGSYIYDPTSSGTMQALAVGEYLEDSFNYTVSDGNGGMGTGTVTINVTGVNDAPTISTANVLEIVTGQEYSVDYDAVDVDITDTMNWTLNTDATYLQLNSTTGLLNGTPSNAAVGTYWINVSVNDGNNGTDFTNFTLTVILDTDQDGIPNFEDNDDDADGWNDTIELLAGSDPLDNSSIPSDADSDGIADFMDADFLTTTEYNNQTVNQTVWDNVTAYSNTTVWNNGTIDGSEDSDGDGWSDAEEILAGTDLDDATDEPADADGNGIADFMDPAEPETITVTETPAWAYIAAAVAGIMTVLALIGFGRKPESKHPDEREEFEKEDDMDLKEKEDDEEGTLSYAETQTPYDRLG